MCSPVLQSASPQTLVGGCPPDVRLICANEHAIMIDLHNDGKCPGKAIREAPDWNTSRDCHTLSHCPTLNVAVGRAAQQRRRWPPRGSLTILFIILARRVFGRNLVGLSPPFCAPKSSLTPLVGDAVAVDPAISSGLPLPALNRQPPPGSRPEKYSTPATKGFAHLLFHVTVCV